MAKRLINAQLREEVTGQLKGFQNPSHAKALAEGILRTCKDEAALPGRLDQANAVVAAVMGKGVGSFFAAEYGKLFTEPEKALSTRECLMRDLEQAHGLGPKQSAMIADRVVFSAAKKMDVSLIARMAKLASEALAAGVAFKAVYVTVYYNAPDVPAKDFALRCVVSCAKGGMPLAISQNDLVDRLSKAVA